jgi:tetratricopeptide (TPR) repeat protein
MYRRWQCLAFLLAFLISSDALRAADLKEAEDLLRTGRYAECIAMSKVEVERTVWNEGWPRTLLAAYLATGKYDEAVEVYRSNIERFSTSIRMRMLGAHAYRLTNDAKQAAAELEVIPELVQRVPWRFNSKTELIALGDYFLSRGEDPKQVLELCYDKATKEDPKLVEAYVASARLAISKMDDQVALASLKKAIELDDDDPEIHFLLAQAWSNSDSDKASTYIQQALTLNSNHVPSMLWLAESKIDAERYDDAERLLRKIEIVNPKQPELWALRSAIAHLEGRYEAEGEMRRRALQTWPLNPEVDHLIGKQLANHYRFSESVEYQRRALLAKNDYIPARTQLAQDLLRLGAGDEGWKLVDDVRKADPYNVPIFNLKKLHARLEKFATLEAPGLIIRMDAVEAKIFGNAVVELLSEARRVLTEKYVFKLEEPVYVEIFPKQSDFAIRTFGLPGGAGFLGVCFGRLITANSPSALDVASNWKAVLWHEYCHVVTLQKTQNRMPRWLSEGISVYEERQRDPRWGQAMSVEYRDMILGEDLVPVSQLSGAFLRPKSPKHLQFAYFESSMVVEYWIEKYGLKSLQRVLNDLSVGLSAQESLGREAGGIDALDAEFAQYAWKKARQFGGDTEFTKPNEPVPETSEEWQAWLDSNPNSYWGVLGLCRALIQEEKWQSALPIAEKLTKILPGNQSSSIGHTLLARIYHRLEQTDNQRQALVEIENRTSDSLDVLLQLIEIDLQKNDSKSVLAWCNRVLEIDPMRSSVHETRAAAAESLERWSEAVNSLKAIIALDPIDAAVIHYRLAVSLLALDKNDEAKRHLLMALEESPRYREALALLLEHFDSPP